MQARKLYISGLVALLAFGGIIVVASIVVATHDANHYQALPEAYRAGIEKLQQDWHYLGLYEDEQEAILDQHQRWKDEEKLPWWGADAAVDPNTQKAETLANFKKLVPRWGFHLHQQRPLVAIGISLLAFVPAIVLACAAKWLLWLRAP